MPVVFESWRNQQELCNYPFADWATLGGGTPAALPNNMFLDAVLYPIGAGEGIHLSEIRTDGSNVVFVISDQTHELATGTFDTADPDATDTIELFDSYERIAGVLVGDPVELRALSSWSEGERTYSYADTGFTPTALIPLPQIGVRGLTLESGEILSGDCWVVGERGVTLTVDDGAIRIDLVGDITSRRRICEQLNSYQQPWFLRTINFMGPSQAGSFSILPGTSIAVDSALRIVPEGNGLSISLAGKSIHAPA